MSSTHIFMVLNTYVQSEEHGACRETKEYSHSSAVLQLCDLGQVTFVPSFVHEVMRRLKKDKVDMSGICNLLLRTWGSLNIIKIILDLMCWMRSKYCYNFHAFFTRMCNFMCAKSVLKIAESFIEVTFKNKSAIGNVNFDNLRCLPGSPL